MRTFTIVKKRIEQIRNDRVSSREWFVLDDAVTGERIGQFARKWQATSEARFLWAESLKDCGMAAAMAAGKLEAEGRKPWIAA